MKVKHQTVGIALAGALMATAACGSSENAIEDLIEDETGEDVEIDLEDGAFSLETEDGSFSIDEEGNIVAVGEDGEVVTGQIDDDGFTIRSEDGEVVTGDIGDDGDVTVQSEDGEVTIEGGDDGGSVEISGDDGDVSFEAGDEIPEEWPAEIPQPTGLTVLSGATFVEDGQTSVTLVGTVGGDVMQYVNDYGATLEAAGIPQTGSFESGGSVSLFHESATWVVSVTGAPSGDGSNQISIFAAPAN